MSGMPMHRCGMSTRRVFSGFDVLIFFSNVIPGYAFVVRRGSALTVVYTSYDRTTPRHRPWQPS